MKSDDPWFIARDGQQHGPLSEQEMQVFVERGHLRPNDLIWRQGFPDWRPAQSVFPPKPQTEPAPQTSSAGPTPPHQVTQSTPGPVAEPGISQASDGGDNTVANPDHYIEIDESAPGWGRAIATTVILGALSGIALWFFLHGPTNLFDQANLNGKSIPVVKAPITADATKTETKPKPVQATKIDVDQRLQKAELWQFLKAQYPKWYASVLSNTDQLDQGDGFDRRLSELLISRLIELRRLNADKVLASSPQSLANVATSFLDNLKHLAGLGAEPCYTFISKGEASPAVVDIMRKPGDTAPIHNQLLATFKASVEGQKKPVTHAPPLKTDYEALTNQLAKIGWNKEDIQLFANPKALSQAPPARVCQMVQDWFSAHLSLENAEIQERLLFETLRPVVSG